jgi:hypothetical protein
VFAEFGDELCTSVTGVAAFLDNFGENFFGENTSETDGSSTVPTSDVNTFFAEPMALPALKYRFLGRGEVALLTLEIFGQCFKPHQDWIRFNVS